jgi:hypothetical protein
MRDAPTTRQHPRRAPTERLSRKRTPKKINAGKHEAFRRLNYAFLILVGKGDAKSRHSEILIVAAMTRSELKRLVNNGGLGHSRSEN